MTQTPRRRQLLDAAQAVIADEGLKGLTHRAVDRRAGLPEGSCSAYLRTRQALQAALAAHVAEQLVADVDRLADQLRDLGETDGVDATLDLFSRWLEQRDLLVARLELTMAATRDPGLAHVLAHHRARLLEIVEGIMTATGKEHGAARAETLVASYDGILLSALLRPDPERRDFLARSLELLGAGLAGPPAT
ncbi:MAG: TetR/AcrR family transcriptional regulator [Nocardioides sp.]|nr:TetR/AcrR family transcriptional regulator [Nocardioides sp.]